MNLFRYHFNLYHSLYLLKDKLSLKKQELLYIRLSTCYLLQIPQDSCSYYYEEEIRFCGEALISSQPYCHSHYLLMEKQKEMPSHRGIRDYYLDRSHYDSMDEEKLDHMTRGMTDWLTSSEEILHSLKIMGLGEEFSLGRLKNRFRYLARQHHPDKTGRQEDFQEVRQAYELLKSWKESKKPESLE